MWGRTGLGGSGEGGEKGLEARSPDRLMGGSGICGGNRIGGALWNMERLGRRMSEGGRRGFC